MGEVCEKCGKHPIGKGILLGKKVCDFCWWNRKRTRSRASSKREEFYEDWLKKEPK